MRLLWPRLMRSNIFVYFVYFPCALTPHTKPPHVCSQLDRRDRDGSGRWRELRDCWAERLRQNDRTIDKTKVLCSICQAEFSYHRSSSSLSYHLNAKHPTESSPRLDGRQPTLHDFTKITR